MSDFTPAQIANQVASFRAAGVSEADIAEGFADYAIPPITGPDTRSQEQKDLETAGLAPATDPAAYTPHWYGGHGPTMTPELAGVLGANPIAGIKDQTLPGKIDAAMREGMAQIGMPASTGTALIEMGADAARRFANYTETEKSLARKSAAHAVTEIFGPDALQDARSVLDRWRVKAPAVVHALQEADYFSDSRILGNLVLAARRGKS
jgi:hypothetical protein